MIAYAVRVIIAAEVIIQIVSEADADFQAPYRPKAQLRSNSEMEGVARKPCSYLASGHQFAFHVIR